MIAVRRCFARYRQDEGGAYAVMFALTLGFMTLAAHVGLDALRVQNSGTAAEQIVDIACQKIAAADPAIYPTAEALKAGIENQMATRRVAGTDTSDGALTVEIGAPDTSFVTPINADGSHADLRRYTFTVRYQGNVGGLHKDIARNGRADVRFGKRCKPVCAAMTNVFYSNGAAIGHWMDGLTLKAAEYVDSQNQMIDSFSTVGFDSGYQNPGLSGGRFVLTILSGPPNERRVRYRKIITLPETFYIDSDAKRAPGEPSVRKYTRIVADENDQLVLQALNVDGSVPPPCGDAEIAAPCLGAGCGGSIGGGDPCTGDCGSTGYVCNFSNLPPASNSFLKINTGDTARFVYEDGQPSKLQMTWSNGRQISVKLAPFYQANTQMVTVNYKTGGSGRLPAEQASALSYMSLGNRYLFLAPTQKYPNHRYLAYLSGWQFSWWWDGHENCFHFKSPIVFDTRDLGRIETTRDRNIKADPEFDYFGNGTKVKLEWPVGEGQAWLIDNRDGRAAFDMNGRRFFGDLDGHEDGYAKLAQLDTSGTGILTGRDLEGLALWFDNGNAVVDESELRSVVEAGVTAIDTRGQWVTLPDGQEALRSTAVMNGRTIMTEDIYISITIPALRVGAHDAEHAK